jgi:hypothetical protein
MVTGLGEFFLLQPAAAFEQYGFRAQKRCPSTLIGGNRARPFSLSKTGDFPPAFRPQTGGKEKRSVYMLAVVVRLRKIIHIWPFRR